MIGFVLKDDGNVFHFQLKSFYLLFDEQSFFHGVTFSFC